MSGRLVIRLLEQAVDELGTTVIAASHDADVIAAASTRLVLSTAGARADLSAH
jgi:ABC-type ATPase involved in cell division